MLNVRSRDQFGKAAWFNGPNGSPLNQANLEIDSPVTRFELGCRSVTPRCLALALASGIFFRPTQARQAGKPDPPASGVKILPAAVSSEQSKIVTAVKINNFFFI